MRKEDELILEALYYLLNENNLDSKDRIKKVVLIQEIRDFLNPKSQEMPFKDTLEEIK